MASTDWIFDGRDVYQEFKEEQETDATGAVTSQYINARLVYVFKRHKIIELTGDISIAATQVGTTSTGGIYGYKGAYKVTASVIITGSGNKIWECTQDAHPASDPWQPWYEQAQTWESRAEWAFYDWAEVP